MFLYMEPDPYTSQLITTLFIVFVAFFHQDLWEELFKNCIYSNFLLI